MKYKRLLLYVLFLILIISSLGTLSGCATDILIIGEDKVFVYSGEPVPIDYITTNMGDIAELSLVLRKGSTVINEIVDAGTYQIIATVKESQRYKQASRTFTVIVSKRPVSIETLPEASEITYSEQLKDSELSGGAVVDGIEGTFNWANPNLVPVPNSEGYDVTFTPLDNNYDSVTFKVAVTVNKADIQLITAPQPSAITYGELLTRSNLSGGRVETAKGVQVQGRFEWTLTDGMEPDTIFPEVGAGGYKAVFIPNTDYYNPLIITVTDFVFKANPTITSSPLALHIFYGQTLSFSQLMGGTADVAGVFNWKFPSSILDRSITSAPVIFTPNDTDNYSVAEISVQVDIRKATPTILQAPTASTILSGNPLNTSIISGQAVNPYTGTAISGQFSFTNPGFVPSANVSTSVYFVPDNDLNYNNSGNIQITVQVIKRTIEQITFPTFPLDISYGKSLSEIALTNGSASVAGTFAWINQAVIPTVGLRTYQVRFTPVDTNYETITRNVTINIVEADTYLDEYPELSRIFIEDILYDSQITGGKVRYGDNLLAIGYFVWVDPLIHPTSEDNTYEIRFIPSGAHYGNLKELVFTVTLTLYESISSFIFEDIGEGIAILGFSPGYDYSLLSNLEFPDTISSKSVTVIGEEAFSGIANLNTMTLPSGLKHIGNNAFAGSGLTSIALPSSVISVGKGAFSNLDKLNSISLNEGLLNIGELAFMNAGPLNYLSIPSTVESLGYGFLAGSSINNIVINSPYYQVAGSAIYSSDGKLLHTYLSGNDGQYFVIPNEVEEIAPRAFQNSTKLIYIVIPYNVSRIGDLAFYGCASLGDVYFANDAEISRTAFEGAYYGLTLYLRADSSIAQYASINKIAFKAWTDASHFNTINSGEGVIITGLKQSIAGISSIVVPMYIDNKLVIGIADNAFNGQLYINLRVIQEIILPPSIESIGARAFEGLSSLSNILIPYTVNTIASYAFGFTSSLIEVVFLNDIDNLENNIFYNSNQAIKVYGPTEGVLYEYLTQAGIAFNDGTYSFSFIYSLIRGYDGEQVIEIMGVRPEFDEEIIYIPSFINGFRVESIAGGAFSDYSTIREIHIPRTILTIGTAAFGSHLNSIIIDAENPVFMMAGNLLIDESSRRTLHTYIELNELSSYVIPNNIYVINREAFINAPSLVSLTLAPTIDNLMAGAFLGSNIRHINGNNYYTFNGGALYTYDMRGLIYYAKEGDYFAVPYSVESINDYAFAYCELISITVEGMLIQLGEGAFYNANSLIEVYFAYDALIIGDNAFLTNSGLTVKSPYAPNIEGNAIVSGAVFMTVSSRDIFSYVILSGGDLMITGLSQNVDITTHTDLVIPRYITYISAGQLITGRVTVINEYAFAYNYFVLSVIIPDTVQSIGVGAFMDCINLKTLMLEGDVMSIGARAFYNASMLNIVSFSGDIGYLGSNCFYNNPSAVFYGMVGSNIETILASYGISLIDIELKNNFTYRVIDGEIEITGLSNSVYYSLNVVVIPEHIDGMTVTAIANNAFINNPNIVSINMPKTINRIGTGALSGIGKLINIELNLNQDYIMYNGALMTSDLSELIIYLSGNKPIVFTVPESVTAIWDMAFMNNIYLRQIFFSNNPVMGEDVFLGTAVTVYAPEWDNELYYYCIINDISYRALSSEGDFTLRIIDSDNVAISSVLSLSGVIAIPATISGRRVIEIDDMAFMNNPAYAVILPEGLIRIGERAFENMFNLRSIVIPNSVSIMGGWAFNNCRSLNEVYFSGDVSVLGANIFNNTKSALNNRYYLTIYGPLGGNLESYLKSYEPYETFRPFNIGTPISSFNYTVESEGIKITGIRADSYGNISNVIIPENIDNLPVTAIGAGAFTGSRMLSVTIPDSVIVIENGAFRNAVNLLEVILPDSVLYIGDYAFAGNTSLTNIRLSGSLISIGSYALMNNRSLTSIRIPNGVIELGEGALYGASGLTSVTLSSQLDEIKPYTFYGASKLIGINTYDFMGSIVSGYPINLSSIGEYAFYGCSAFMLSELHEGILSIGAKAFAYTAISGEIVIPASLTSIGTGVYNGCNVSNVTVSEGNIDFVDYEGALLSADLSILYMYLSNGSSFEIPEGVESILVDAFSGKENLTELYIPNTVDSIASGAFSGCISLSVVSIDPMNVSYVFVENNAKVLYSADMTELVLYMPYNNLTVTSFTLPETVIKISDMAFMGMDRLNRLTLNEGLIDIGEKAFYGTSIRQLTLPESVSLIGDSAFRGINGLELVYIVNNIEFLDLDTRIFDNNGLTILSAAPIAVNSLLTVYEYARAYNIKYVETSRLSMFVFEQVSAGSFKVIGFTEGVAVEGELIIPSMTLNGSVIAINDFAFYNRADITSVVIPSSVRSIGAYAFDNCFNLSEVYFESDLDSVSNIGLNAFRNTDIRLRMFALSGGAVNSYCLSRGISFNKGTSRYAFKYYIEEDGVVISGIKYLMSYIRNIVIPEYIGGRPVIGIAEDAFSGQNILSVTIPSSVATIGERAFSGSLSLKSVYIEGEDTVIGEGAFIGCPLNMTVYAPLNNLQAIDYLNSNYINYEASSPASYFDYISVYGGIMVTGLTEHFFLSGETILYIPSYIGGLPVVSIGNFAFTALNLTRVYIGDNVISIGDNAFEGCVSLDYVYLPQGLKIIGQRAFFNTVSLMEIVLPDSVETIGQDAFYLGIEIINLENISNIFSFRLLDDETIEITGLREGVSAKELIIPAEIGGRSVTSIAAFAFVLNSEIISVELPDTLINIGVMAFSGLSKLREIMIPDSVMSIGDYAFMGANSLSFIEIGSGTNYIGDGAFDGCVNLINFSISPLNAVYSFSKGMLFSGDTIIRYLESNKESTLIIPDNTDSISDNAFRGVSRLKVIAVSGELEISASAFYGIEGLKEIHFEKEPNDPSVWAHNLSYTVIYYAEGISCFDDYTGEIIMVSADIFMVSDGAIVGIDEAKRSIAGGKGYDIINLVLPRFIGGEEIVSIGDNAFKDRDIESIVIGFLVYTIGNSAFSGSSLRSAVIGDYTVAIGDEAFMNCEELISIQLGYRVSDIGINAFKGLVSLEDIVISPLNRSIRQIEVSSVKALMSYNMTALYLYYMSNSISSLYLPEGVEVIKQGAFNGNTALTDLYLPSTLRVIEEGAINDTINLENICILSFIEEIKEAAFSNVSELFTIHSYQGGIAESYSIEYDIPFKVVTPINCFKYTIDSDKVTITGLNYLYGDILVIPEHINNLPVTRIGNGAFYGLSGVNRIVLPDTLKVIGTNAFAYSSINLIVIPWSVEEIRSGAFAYCNNLTEIHYERESNTVMQANVFIGISSITAYTANDTLVNYLTINGISSIKTTGASYFTFVKLNANEVYITGLNMPIDNPIPPHYIDGYRVAGIAPGVII